MAAGSVRLGGQVDRGRPAHTAADQVGDVGRGLLGVQHGGDGRSPAQVQVGVVLPGETDPAVHLDVEAGVTDRGGHGQRRRDGRGVAELVTAADPGPARIPGRGAGQFGGDQHVRAVVLDRLEGRDRAAELLADLRVPGRLFGRLGGQAGRLGGQQRPGHVGQQPAGTGQHGGRCGVERDPGRGPALIQVDRHLGPDPARRRLDDQDVVTRRDQQDVGQMAADDHACRPGGGPVGAGHLTTQRGRADHGAVGQPGQQPLLQLVRPGRGQHGTGDHGGQERPGRQVTAHLLGDDQRFRQAEAGAAAFFRDVQPEQAESGQFGPEVGQPGCLGIE